MCSQHQAVSFDLGTRVLLESVLVETALELWRAELAGLGSAGVNDREMFSDYRLTVT